jgi:all-trans-8'-apo-beta-carotenal 15,15'-oxygenase
MASVVTDVREEQDELAFRRAMGKGFRSLAREHGFEPLEIEGALPRELRGTLYRNGPGMFEAQGTPYRHWLDGDGMMSAVRLNEGRAEGAARIVVTRELAEERAKKRMIYGSGFTQGPVWHKRLMGGGKNGTNVHVLEWRGRIFAMPENGLPHEVDPRTLETKGPWKLDGVLEQLINAHVRIDPASGDIYAFGPTIGMRNTLDVYVLPKSGPVRLLTSIPMSKPVMVIHDLAYSARHLVFVQHPVRARLAPILLGIGTPMDAISYHEDEGSEIIVVPLDDPKRLVRMRVPAFFHFHYANAFEEGQHRIAVDLSRYPGFSLGDMFMLDGLRSGEGWRRAPIATLERMHVDLEKKSVEWETVWNANCDFGVTHPDKQGRKARYLWGLVCRDHVDYIEKLDTETGVARRSTFAAHECPTEPTFVPRAGSEREDDGFILTMVYDAERDVSLLAVLDASDPSRILARARFAHHLPIALHGIWVSG